MTSRNRIIHPALRVVGGGCAVLLMLAGAAIAVTGYNVNISADRRTKSGHTFTVRVTGNAPHRSVVNVWLDPQPCAPTAQSEGQHPSYKPGDSYFVDAAGGGARVTYSSWPYTGAFVDTQTAHAGTHTGRNHICAYVNELDAGPNNGRAMATRRYRITTN